MMWKSLKTLVEIIAELPSEDRIAPQAMPQTHYLNGEQSFADELTHLLPKESAHSWIKTRFGRTDEALPYKYPMKESLAS